MCDDKVCKLTELKNQLGHDVVRYIGDINKANVNIHNSLVLAVKANHISILNAILACGDLGYKFDDIDEVYTNDNDLVIVYGGDLELSVEVDLPSGTYKICGQFYDATNENEVCEEYTTKEIKEVAARLFSIRAMAELL